MHGLYSNEYLFIMRFGPILTLLALHLYQCNGAPPKEVATKANSNVIYRFTEQEDRFITEEISRLPLDSQQVFSKSFWEHMADRHREKREQKTRGFPQERTWKALRTHLKHMVKHNNPELIKKVPEDVLRRFRTHWSDLAHDHRQAYTPEEEKFIIEELSKPASSKIYAMSRLQALREKHAEKRRAKTHGFKTERSIYALRTHIHVMKRDGKLPDEVVKKIGKTEKGASSSGPTPPDQATDLETTNEEDLDEESEFDYTTFFQFD